MSLQRTILIIDDDESLRRALQRLLISAGLAVVTFGSAEEFLQFNGQPGPA